RARAGAPTPRTARQRPRARSTAGTGRQAGWPSIGDRRPARSGGGRPPSSPPCRRRAARAGEAPPRAAHDACLIVLTQRADRYSSWIVRAGRRFRDRALSGPPSREGEPSPTGERWSVWAQARTQRVFLQARFTHAKDEHGFLGE